MPQDNRTAGGLDQAMTLATDFMESCKAAGVHATLRHGPQPQRQAGAITQAPVRSVEQLRNELAQCERAERDWMYSSKPARGSFYAAREAGKLRAELARLESAQ